MKYTHVATLPLIVPIIIYYVQFLMRFVLCAQKKKIDDVYNKEVDEVV